MRSRRPSHATVVAYLALFVALGGTSAYAANTIFSSDIVDGEVKAPDLASEAVTTGKLKPGAVTTDRLAGGAVTSDKVKDNNLGGRDVLDNSLKGADIDESTLTNIGGGGPAGGDLTGTYPNPLIAPDAVGSAEVADNSLTGDDIDEVSLAQVPNAALGGVGRSAGSGSCSPGADFFTCKFVSVTLPSPSRVLVIAAANAYSPNPSAQGTCELATDLGDMGNTSMPVLVDNTSLINLAGDAISISGVTPPMIGAHDFAIRCKEQDGEIRFSDVQVSAVALSPN